MTPIALTIAGSDSSGGAGIQADLKTFSALGVYGASVIAALTAQNTKGVSGILDVPAAFITAQIDAVFSDLKVGAVKIGMLSNAPAIEAVAAGLERHRVKNIVLDPVMVASSGDRLLRPDAVDALRKRLIPMALVITPNLPEAAVLLDRPVAEDEMAMRGQAERLLLAGAQAVLIKGGHGKGARQRRPAGGQPYRHAASRAAFSDREHAWHRLHAVGGDRGRSRQRPGAGRGGARGQGLRHPRHRRSRPARRRLRPRAGASFSRLVVTLFAQGDAS